MAKAIAPTPESRQIVQRAIAAGLRQEEVSLVLGIGVKALRKHYSTEIANGMPVALNAVAESLYDMATRGKNVTAMIFYLKCRGGNAWREQQNVAPPPVAPEGFDVARYSFAQLTLVRRILENPSLAPAERVRALEAAAAPAGAARDGATTAL